MRSKLNNTRFFSNANNNLKGLLAGKMPNFLFERKKNHGYDFFDVASGENTQLMMFVGKVNNNSKSPLSDHLPMMQTIDKELAPALMKRNIDFRMVVSGYNDVLEGLMDCYQITQRYQLMLPLLYIRKIPEKESLHEQCSVSDFQDHSFVVTPGSRISEQIDHSDYPNVSERCQKILDSVENVQEKMSVKRFN